ncbi:MAG: TetR family transcriptional regulator C-terminal domain-containing protein [Pseudomonadota bacterium]
MPKSAADRLIEGTIRSIAKHGIEGTTVTNIVAEAGLTRAMIMKALGNKDTLLRATAERFGEDYFEKVAELTKTVGPDPKDRVRAMIRADLCEAVLNADTIAVLSVMRSLAQNDPKIRAFSSTRDRRLRTAYTTAIADALGRPDPEGNLAKDLATATIAMLEGFWADYFLFMDSFDREKAEHLVLMLLEPYWDRRPDT